MKNNIDRSKTSGKYTHIMSYTTDSTRWRALATRDPNANGLFVYSVKSTGIYCRPICPARLARRANIGFFKTTNEAEAAGFRACKRCKPNVEVQDPQDRAVAQACTLIEAALKRSDPKTFKLHDLAKKVGLTPRYFHKIFKDKIGVTPREYAKIVAAQQDSSSATPVSGVALSDLEPFDWDTFDIADLAAFGLDVDASPDGEFAAGAAQVSESGFADEIDRLFDLQQYSQNLYEYDSPGNQILPAYDTSFYPIESLLPTAMDQDSSIKSMPTVSTLELDAAALLSSDDLADLESSVNTAVQASDSFEQRGTEVIW
jgi:methylphosphotriester-DNA--protein-cysteine methyltransferase